MFVAGVTLTIVAAASLETVRGAALLAGAAADGAVSALCPYTLCVPASARKRDVMTTREQQYLTAKTS
jgi:hypothetical protein